MDGSQELSLTLEYVSSDALIVSQLASVYAEVRDCKKDGHEQAVSDEASPYAHRQVEEGLMDADGLLGAPQTTLDGQQAWQG